MKGRTPLPPIIVAGVRADDPSQDADGAYFTRNPAVLEYTRAYIAGETHEPMPLGTRVIFAVSAAIALARSWRRRRG